MRADAADWYARRTTRSADWPLDRVRALKGGHRISVVLPALDEEDTVGAIVAAIRRDLAGGPDPLVDDLLVVDSGSTDRTAQVARDAGARVVHRDEVLPGLPAVAGKGEAMWRSLAATDGDLIAFIDSDRSTSPPPTSPGCSARCSPTRGCSWSRACTTGRWRPDTG